MQELLEVPISALLGKDNQHTETLPDKRITYSYRYGNEVIWGATARILKPLLDIIREVI